jgi:hypothetical protein
MTIRDRMLALRQHVQSMIAGAPVWAYEPVPYPASIKESSINIDDCSEVYLDNVIEMFPEIDTPCGKSPSGQCEYTISDNFHACEHCGQPSGLDQ